MNTYPNEPWVTAADVARCLSGTAKREYYVSGERRYMYPECVDVADGESFTIRFEHRRFRVTVEEVITSFTVGHWHNLLIDMQWDMHCAHTAFVSDLSELIRQDIGGESVQELDDQFDELLDEVWTP